VGKSWFGSKWVRIGSAAIFVLLLGVLAAPFLIPVDSYRPLLVWAAESATGRQIQIDRLKLYLFPTVRISVLNFRMENPAGFPAGDALVAKSIDLGIVPQALLSRRIDVTYIAPDGVQVNVIRDTNGRTNFAVPVPPRNAAPSQPGVFTLDHVGSVDVQDATVTFADAPNAKRPAPSFTLSGVSAKIGSIDPQARDWAKSLEIVADLRGARLTTLLLTEPVEFRDGELTYKSGAARGTFSASVGNAAFSGSVAFARLDPLSIAFSLTGPELDVDTLARLVQPGAKSMAPGPTARNLLAHGTVKFGRVLYSPLEATDMSGQLKIYANAVRLDGCTLSAYGGIVRESATLDGSAGAPATVNARVHGLDVQRALAAFGLASSRVTGTFDAGFNARTLLASDAEQTLTAAGTFALYNGSFPGMDFKSQLAQTAKILGLNVPSGDTRFSYFGGDLRIAHERGSSNLLRLLATGMQATMQGSFGFDQALSYSGTGVLDSLTKPSASSPLLAEAQQYLSNALQSAVGAARVQVPFTLRGTLEGPQFALAGTPQLLTAANQGSQPQAAAAPAVQNLLQLIPGLHL
jgi:uncharacterized protein involved in outer membrane biogenesis